MLLRPLYVCQRCILRQSRLSRPPRRGFHSSGIRQGLAPALLRRARAISEENAELVKKLEGSYDAATARRAGQTSAVSQALKEYDEALSNIQELNAMLRDDSVQQDPDLRALAQADIASTTASLGTLTQTLQRTLVPKHPFAHLPALIEIRPGTGGSEAAIFANDLWRMYTAYCALRSWPYTVVSHSAAEGSGGDAIVEGIFEIPIEGAYEQLRLEAGVHRVQRVPATETKGRVHTSTATVMVLPSFPSVAEGEEDPDSQIDMKDVRVDIMRARGAGGQHVNTTDSAVRMTHIPTGLVAAIQDSRSQHKNREKCLSVLKARVAAKRREEREAEELKMRRSAAKVGAGRSDKIRTYNYSQNRITDHRPGFSLHNMDAFMAGEELGAMMEEVRKWRMEIDVDMLGEE